MADAKRDKNQIPTLLAVSSVDGITPVPLWADPTTHRLLVDSTGGAAGSLPSGVQMTWPGLIAKLPATLLFENGQAVSRTTNAALFAAIGTKYGAGNGSTTFNIPDLRDVFIVGASSEDINTPTSTIYGVANATGGNINTTVDLGNFGVSISDPGHQHNISGSNSITVDVNGDGATCNFGYTNTSSTDSASSGVSASFFNTGCVTVNVVPSSRAAYPVIVI